MAIIHVPVPVRKPPQSSMDPDRPASGLLKAQVQHLQEAERNLPLRYRSEIYANAIRTEGEAARYIRAVTEAIIRAHSEAAAERAMPTFRRKRGIEIAAVAQSGAAKKSAGPTKRKRKSVPQNRRS